MPYVGRELEVFAQAANWKRYWSSQIREYLAGDVLEVGAGLGANTEILYSDYCSSWTCLEPDPSLASAIKVRTTSDQKLLHCQVETNTIANLASGSQFDTILYIDVLEHIEHDGEELARAVTCLRSGGRIIVLAPAHQQLYSPFDAAIGHFRRYNRASLLACSPPKCSLEKIGYLDSVGLLASLANRLLLRQSDPTLSQILFWDRLLVPVSTLIDRITFHRFGKSIMVVWRKER